jgi:hypothetical protein
VFGCSFRHAQVTTVLVHAMPLPNSASCKQAFVVERYHRDKPTTTTNKQNTTTNKQNTTNNTSKHTTTNTNKQNITSNNNDNDNNDDDNDDDDDDETRATNRTQSWSKKRFHYRFVYLTSDGALRHVPIILESTTTTTNNNNNNNGTSSGGDDVHIYVPDRTTTLPQFVARPVENMWRYTTTHDRTVPKHLRSSCWVRFSLCSLLFTFVSFCFVLFRFALFCFVLFPFFC